MEPGRFDDVEFQFLERPEPPPRGPRRRRWAAALLGAGTLAVGVTAGASALTGSGDEPARKAAPAKPRVSYNADGVPTMRSGYECRAGKRSRRRHDAEQSSVRY